MADKNRDIPRDKNDPLLDSQSAADFIHVTPGTLSVWRSTGRYGLPFIKIGAKVRYRTSDLIAWIESRTRESGATAGSAKQIGSAQ